MHISTWIDCFVNICIVLKLAGTRLEPVLVVELTCCDKMPVVVRMVFCRGRARGGCIWIGWIPDRNPKSLNTTSYLPSVWPQWVSSTECSKPRRPVRHHSKSAWMNGEWHIGWPWELPLLDIVTVAWLFLMVGLLSSVFTKDSISWSHVPGQIWLSLCIW